MEFVTIVPVIGSTAFQPLSWIIFGGIIAAYFLGFVMGANDVANSFGTTVGAGILSMKQALIVASIFDVFGSCTLGVGVAKTIASKIIDVSIYDDMPALYALGMFCASVGAACCVGVATKVGLPISTTHAVIGAVVGFSFVETSDGVIWWGPGKTGMGSIVLSWVISPLFAGVVAAMIYVLTRKYCLSVFPLERAFERHKRLASFVTGWVTALIVLLVAYDVTEPGTVFDWLNVVFAALAMVVVSTVSYKWLVPWTIKRAAEKKEAMLAGAVENGDRDAGEKDDDAAASATKPLLGAGNNAGGSHGSDGSDGSSGGAAGVISKGGGKRVDQKVGQKYDGGSGGGGSSAMALGIVYDPLLEERFNSLNILTACFMAFSHGANDISNAAGPFIAVWDTYTKGQVDAEVDTYLWIILICCFGVVCGLAIWGAKVIATVGTKLTAMTPSRAYSMNLGTATAVLVASFAKMPVSSTHCMVGSVVAVGLCNGEGTKAIKWKMVRNIAVSWVVTVPLAGMVSAVLYAALRPVVAGVSLPPNAELVGCIGNCSVLPNGTINVTAFSQWYSIMGY